MNDVKNSTRKSDGWTAHRLACPCIALALIMLAGCQDLYRVNHFHSDTNQKAADGSVTAFDDFTGQTAGLEPLLLKNIDARRQLEQVVGDSRSRVRDAQANALTTDATWERLRLETYVRLGLLVRTEDSHGAPLNPPVPLHLDVPGDLAYARDKAQLPVGDAGYGNYDALLSERITVREMKVTAIAKVLKLIGDANQVLADDTNKRYKQTQDELVKLRSGDSAPADTKTKTVAELPNDDHVQWVRELFLKILQTRDAYAKDEQLLKTANDLQRKVLADIESSRDPVEAAALVPVVGAGLSDYDFTILDAYTNALNKYLKELQTSIAKIDDKDQNKRKAIDDTSPPDPAWTNVKQSLCQARIWIELAVWLSLDNSDYDPNNVFPGIGTRIIPLGQNEADDFAAKVKRRLLSINGLPDPVAQAKEELEKLLDECDGPMPAGQPRNVPAAKADSNKSLEAARAMLSDAQKSHFQKVVNLLQLGQSFEQSLIFRAAASGGARNSSALQDAIDAIRQARQSIKLTTVVSRNIANSAAKDPSGRRRVAKKIVQSTAKQAPQRAQVNQILSDAAKLVSGTTKVDSDSVFTDPTTEKGFEFLNQFLGLDVKIAGLFKQVVSDEQFKKLGTIVDGIASDIQKEEVAKHERTLVFLDDLYGAAVDLGQENARHAQGMLTVANIELRRWELIGRLNDDYSIVFRAGDDGPYPLFAAQPDLDKWNEGLPKPGDKIDLRRHPKIGPINLTTKNDESDNILISIRKLGETAKAWQNAPQIADPAGNNLRIANDRLFKAVRTLDGHLLLLSVNQHISEDNVVRLHAELASHDIRLDTLKTRVEEAGYRLTLGDLKAFHGSGVTDQDIQTLADLFANGFLAWIGSGTNNGGK